MLRFLLLLVLMAPPFCLALSPEATFYVGVARSGKLTYISFQSDPPPWSEQQFVYGADTDARLKYCWRNIGADNHAKAQLGCTSTAGTKPEVVFQSGGFVNINRTGLRYKQAMQYFKKTRQQFENLEDYLFCIKGCSPSLPVLIFRFAVEG